MPETGVGEIGQLERSFNEMASSLAESRGGLQRIAGEQAALRRVATLVAEGTPSHHIFTAVAEEVALVFGADVSAILRAEPEGFATVVATYGRDERFVLGSRIRPSDETAVGRALTTGHPVRIDHDAPSPGDRNAESGDPHIRSAVGTPILVEGRPWGAISMASTTRHFSADTEQRLREFTELLATAVANAEARSELLASRARVVAASDEARRRIERDIHDGAQQRLVSLGLELRGIEASLPAELGALRSEVGRLGGALEDVLESLRDLSRGIHPAILSRGGLAAALKALARRSTVPVDLRIDLDERLPEAIEVGAYYLVSEALTNATKHAEAHVVVVRAAVRDAWLELSVRDDGVGGADPSRGSGLIGLRDRAAALGGTLEIVSPPRGGTTIFARVPVRAG
jgi:signal transduction histidine kinase